MGRSRTKNRTGWPANLYPNRDGYKYRHPVSRKEVWLGTDKAKAFAAAKQANALLLSGDDLLARVVGSTETVADAIRVFRADDLPGRGWKPKTATNYESVLNRIEKHFGDKSLETLSVKECATFIRSVTESQRGRQQFRLVLGWVLACAVEEGWLDTNPALATRKHEHKRKRERLTVEAYRAVYEQAEPWLRNAMDLSLLTLLRREDVALVRFADHRDGVLEVMPCKTETTSGARLRITLGEDAKAVVARCRDAIVSPFLIHRLPERARPQEKKAKARLHHTQVLPEQLTRAFADARDAAGITGKHAPTFHEIRSLGAALLLQSGWTKEQVQALLAHTEIAMTEVYLDGHQQPWTEVSASGSLPR